MAWNDRTRTITFSGESLPEIVGRGPGRREWRESMLITRSVRGREALGELYEYTVLAEVGQPDFLRLPADAAQIDLEKIVGSAGTVAIQLPGIGTLRAGQKGETGRANIGANTRYLSGHIASARILCVEDRAAVYEFVLRPSMWWATLNRDSRIFRNKSILDVLSTLLGRYGTIDWRIAGPWSGQPRYPKRDLIRQAWESDWNLAMRLMEEWGLFFWFEHVKDAHSIVISDTLSGFHGHGMAYETLRYHAGGRIDEEYISELSVTCTTTAGAVTVNDHDYMQPRLRESNAPLRERYEDERGTARSRIEVYAPAEFAQPETVNGAASTHDWRDEARHLARVKLEALRCAGLRAQGKGALRGLQPGRTFKLTNYPQTKANREYIVLGCDLDITEAATSSDASRHYSVSSAFELQPIDEFYRLPQVTPRPHVDDEYAVIVTPVHQEREHFEQWTDDKARVLIQYDWDRASRYDGETSIWVRMATQWQGSQMGMVTPGRAGQMVIVSHVHGDPDRPYVSGFVVDAFNLPPWELPRNSALSGWRSQGLEGSLASNHLALDDTHGRMQAQLASDHAKSSLSLGFNTRIDGNKGRQDARGAGFELRTDGHGVARAAKGMLVTTEARENARGHATDMGETLARLTQASDIHESVAELAQRHGAQSGGDQAEVARSIKHATDAVRGAGESGAEYTAPHLTLASPAGIQTTTAGSTHLASDEDMALTAGRNVSFAAARSLLASVIESVSLFAHKAGIRLTAAAGKIRIEAQSEAVQIIARRNAEIVSADGWINLTGAKGIRLNGGGSVIEIGAQGITGLTNGAFLVHAADHATDGPQDTPVKMPLTDVADAKVVEHFVLVEHSSGFRLPEQPYRITLDDGTVLKSVSNSLGETSLVLSDAVQFATVAILHDDGSDNPIGISRVALTRDGEAMAPALSTMEKRSSQTFGTKEAFKNQNVPTSENKYASLAKCSPNNWGMRYSVAHDSQTGKLAYPVADAYANAIHLCLLEKVKWGESYFGKNESEATLRLTWPIDGDSANELADLVAPILKAALQSKLGDFALPDEALPLIGVESFRASKNYQNIAESQGGFTASRWDLFINTDALQDIFTGTMKNGDAHSQRLKQIRELAKTLYHETRHCQQIFWMYAFVQQNAQSFSGQLDNDKHPLRDLPFIAQWPKRELLQSNQAIAQIAANTKIPGDTAALISIKRMAVAYYLRILTSWKRANWLSNFIPDNNTAIEEISNARAFALDLLKNTGLGGTAIDIDDMAADYPTKDVDYAGRPWEDDAFFTEEVAGCYWDAYVDRGALVLPEPDVCSPKFNSDSRTAYFLAHANDGQPRQ